MTKLFFGTPAMNTLNFKPCRFATALITSAFLLTGCSNSGNPESPTDFVVNRDDTLMDKSGETLFENSNAVVLDNHETNNNDPIVNSTNAVALIRQAFEIFNGSAYDLRLEKSAPISGVYRNPEGTVAGLAVTSLIQRPSEQPDVESIGEYVCTNGGTVRQTTLFSGNNRDFVVSYNNCQIDGDTINGDVTNKATFRGNSRYIFDNYRVGFEPDGQMVLNGTHLIATETRTLGIAVQHRGILSDLDYLFDYPNGNLQVSDSDYIYGYHYNSFVDLDDNIVANTIRNITPESTFLMKPPFSDTKFRVTMNSEMDNQNEDSGNYFDIGQMKITALDDNSSLVLDAETGDIDTSLVSLEHAGQTTSTTTYPWSTWADVFCIGPTHGVVYPPCPDSPRVVE